MQQAISDAEEAFTVSESYQASIAQQEAYGEALVAVEAVRESQ